ncbi:glycolate oxidase subunit GlcF [Acidithiobacillus sp. M4-SHS-6]|uniref:glycolate oxidase subunit GlcF n=1 Tax=Acidithiobacillus sp. M4-SHS-6 TaxID=3383024 RepID=UPI0039BEBA58
MQSQIASAFQNASDIDEAESILRSCVHCGFCTATCPTYQILGDELDGPRGRIYLIKDFLAGQETSSESLEHLDRCLLCRACETTCPSGVRYARLAEIGRREMDKKLTRPLPQHLARVVLRSIFPYPRRMQFLLRFAQAWKGVLREDWAARIPEPCESVDTLSQQGSVHPRVLLFDGCVQQVTTPNTNRALTRVLDHLGVSWALPASAGCCGALSLHLNAEEEAHDFMRRNIDVWWPWVEEGIEAILVSASGCASMLKEYGQSLQDDALYREKARRIAELVRDPADWMVSMGAGISAAKSPRSRIALHNPCSLQHAMGLHGQIEQLLQDAGYELLPVADGHLCCGSAGTYSLLQPELSGELQRRKLENLQAAHPDCIATANVGCQLYLQQKSQVPVQHWLQLLADVLPAQPALP